MEYGRVSLGCDMIEPVRGIFCDRLTLNLFNMQTLKRKDFEMTEEGIRLTIDGRKIFFTKYSDELKKEKSYSLLKGTFHDYLDFMIGYVRTCIETGKAEPMHER
jgi:CRISPR/Cas system-associated endonuclease Cas1